MNKKLVCIGITSILLLTSINILAADVNSYKDEDNEIPFILPDAGAPMAHCDRQMSDNIRLPAPTDNVKIIWNRRAIANDKVGGWISGNGVIAACTFSDIRGDNLLVYDYYGNLIWRSKYLLNYNTAVSVPIVDVHGRIIACDNSNIIMVDPFDYDDDGKIVEWKSALPKGGTPFSPTITEDGIIILATNAGPVYAYDSKDGTLLAYKYLKMDQNDPEEEGFFETLNTPSVKGERVYISTHYNNYTLIPDTGRLYAIDVDPYNPNEDMRLNIAWFYEFPAPSGCSPLLIDNTLYFDGNRSITKDPQLFAVTDMGDYGKEEWRVYTPNVNDASPARDTRGGFWTVDGIDGFLMHYSTEDGQVLEKIDVDGIIQEPGTHKPCSVISIAGNETNPIIIVAALSTDPFNPSSYVIAIDLANNNTLLWKVLISELATISLESCFGQFCILMNNGKPRILFVTLLGGVWAIGNKKTLSISMPKSKTINTPILNFLKNMFPILQKLLQQTRQ